MTKDKRIQEIKEELLSKPKLFSLDNDDGPRALIDGNKVIYPQEETEYIWSFIESKLEEMYEMGRGYGLKEHSMFETWSKECLSGQHPECKWKPCGCVCHNINS